MRSQIFILRSFILLKLCNPGAAARPRLESDTMCGVTTGGREECYWDCGLFNDPYLGVLVTNPECLLDCYQPVSNRDETNLQLWWIQIIIGFMLHLRLWIQIFFPFIGRLSAQPGPRLHWCWWYLRVHPVRHHRPAPLQPPVPHQLPVWGDPAQLHAGVERGADGILPVQWDRDRQRCRLSYYYYDCEHCVGNHYQYTAFL